jgi:hypothetical protein
MFTSKKQVLSFLNGSACRVEAGENSTFNFFGLKPEKPCITVPGKYMNELCNSLFKAKEKVAITTAVQGNDIVVASYPIFTAEDNTDIVLDVQTYSGNVSVWLKKFKTVNGQRRGCPGWVIFNDMDPQILHNFFTECNKPF